MKLAAASWLGPALATLVIAGLGRYAFQHAREHVAKLRWEAAAPKARLAAPISGPAVYAGVLRGPADRRTPLGARATAFWWTVVERKGKAVKTVCAGGARDALSLVDGAASAPLELVAAAPVATLLNDAFDDDWSAPLLLDPGGATESRTSDAPVGDAASCAGQHRSYVERAVPVGTRVEVLACHEGGALRACPGAPHAGVLAIPTLARHRERRIDAALIGFRFFAIGSTAAILVVFIVTLVAKGAVLRGLSSARRGP